MMGRIAKLAAMAAVVLSCTIAPASAQQQTPKWTKEQFSEKVLAYTRKDLQAWINDPVIIYAIKEQNQRHKKMNQLRINRLDFMWREADSYDPLIVEVLDRQASVIARDRRAKSNGIVNEIIVMDAYGLNVAISDRTSDYNQGDEAKWKETFLKGKGAVHISEIEFDESTKKYQTQVSLTVVDPADGKPIGAVTLGISVDKLME